ncbi:MAG: peptide chain release factor N(5)-glutamine methyltransferase [Christensenellales bacterium]
MKQIKDVHIPDFHGMRYSRAYQAIKKCLQQAGLDCADSQARIILEHLGLDLHTLLLFDGIISSSQADELQTILQRRLRREPLQYILGHVPFLGCSIQVCPGVLIPRPETELLAQSVSALALGKDVLDLCCGSGCIGIALAKHGAASVTAADNSLPALQVAKTNALQNGVSIRFVHSDMFAGLSGKKYHVIVSNPPYIPRKELPLLQHEVIGYEPVSALDGGEDGLDFYRILAKHVHAYLQPSGVVCLELGYGQHGAVAGLFKNGYHVELKKDLRGIHRFLFATLL